MYGNAHYRTLNNPRTRPMTSRKQASANRRNARRSTGPKTVKGKAVAALNSTRHGILSAVEVLPGHEDPAEWTAHREAVLGDLAPAGYLEKVLAERVALQLWRLRRVARYERDAAAVGLETLPERVAKSHREAFLSSTMDKDLSDPKKAEARMKDNQEVLDLVGKLPNLSANTRLNQELAANVISEAARFLSVDLYDPDQIALPEYPDGAELKDVPWDAGHLRMALEAIGKAPTNPSTLEDVLYFVGSKAERERNHAERRRDELLRELDQKARLEVLPTDADLEKVGRYETHLERSFYKALHELQRLQAARSGQAVAAPIAVDVDLAVSGQRDRD